MMHPTKQKRLVAIADAYSAVTGKKSYTMDEVATFAMIHGLYPCPKRGDPIEEIEAWEKRLMAVTEPFAKGGATS